MGKELHLKLPSIAAVRLRTEFLQLLFPVLPTYSEHLHKIQVLLLFGIDLKGKWDVQVEKNLNVATAIRQMNRRKELHSAWFLVE